MREVIVVVLPDPADAKMRWFSVIGEVTTRYCSSFSVTLPCENVSV